MEKIEIIADDKQSLIRIDKFLQDRLANSSRNKIQDALKSGDILVNGKGIKPNYKIRPQDKITVQLPEKSHDHELKAQKIDLDIVFEDESILIINKPAGMVVHPGYNNWDETLVNGLIYHFDHLPISQNGEQRPGLVHRIDKDTTGLLVIAKTEASMTHLAKQFSDHSIERTYYAIVWGELKDDKGTIDANIGRSLKDRRLSSVFPEGDFGKTAITHYEVLKRLRYVTLAKCNLETGRTHQIRAHMKYIGHPLFNDAMYGGDKILKGERFSKYKAFVENCFKLLPRQALHAKTLGFIHPETSKYVEFDSELPENFSDLIIKWENYISHH